MKALFLLPVLMLMAQVARADAPYTRSELEQKSKAELIGIILYLQGDNGGGGGSSDCSTYDPLAGQTGTILNVRNHSGYNDHGTLSWPNGTIFMLRHNGYNDDKTLSYPNGNRMVLRHNGYNDNNTVYWPNGATMLLRHNGYNDNGTVYRADGSVWLRRHSGYSDDLSRYGLPVENYNDGDFSVRGRLTDDNSVRAVTTVSGNGWTLEVAVNGADNSVRVTECYE